MISFHNGDLLESNCDIICHQVNLQGVMGGGLALQIATKHPKCEAEYKRMVQEQNKVELLKGKVCFYCVQASPLEFIANCFSQNEDFTTNYRCVKNCFKDILLFAKMHNLKTIGVPYNYGCGIATGDWNKVEKIFKEIFEDEKDINIQIWRL